MLTYWLNLNMSGLGGLGTPSDPKGSDFLENGAFPGTDHITFKLFGIKTFSSTGINGSGTFKLIFEPWVQGVPYRINGNSGYFNGEFELYGGIFHDLQTLSTIHEASGCVLSKIGGYHPGFINNSGNIVNCLLYWEKGGITVPFGGTSIGNILNTIILQPSGGWDGSWGPPMPLFFSMSTSTVSGLVTNCPSSTGVFNDPPAVITDSTFSAPVTTGSIPIWSGAVANLEDFCLGYYASGIGPTNFASGYYVRFLSELSGAAPLNVNFSGVSNTPSPVYTWSTDSTSYSGNTVSHTYLVSGEYPVQVTATWNIGTVYSGYNTFINETFSGNVFDSWWNTDFTSAYSLISTPSGTAAVFNPGAVTENMRQMTPYSVQVSGNFSLEATFITSGNLNGTWPSIGILTSSGDTGLEGSHWSRQGYDTLYEVAEIHAAGSGFASGFCRVDLETYNVPISFSPELSYSGLHRTVSVKLVRTDGVISGFYREGNSSWSSLSGSIPYSGKALVEINGSNWAKVLNISLGADDGLPYYMSGVSIYKRTTPPSWAYMSGYIYDSFAASGYSPYWSDEFTNSLILDRSGYYAVAGGNYDDRLIPSGTANLSGAFDLQFDIVTVTGVAANESEHFQIMDTTNTLRTEIQWFGGSLYGGTTYVSAPSVNGRRYTARMTRGYYLLSNGTPVLETPQSGIHHYYFDNWSGGATNTWREFGGSPVTPTNWSGGVWVRVNGADLNGLDNLKLQAEQGMPLSAEIYNTYIGESGVITSSGTVSYSDEIIVVYLPSVDIDGMVEGQGEIFSFDSYEDILEGIVNGNGKISSIITMIYTPTADPPTSSGTILKTIRPILTNKNRFPYKIPNDTIVSKIDVLQNGRLSYLSGLPVELWMNYSGSWNKCEDATTDRYGSCYISHPTTNIPNITNCLGVVKVAYGDGYYISNLMRYNFYSGLAPDILYYIDADLPSGIPDRSLYSIFEARGSTYYSGILGCTWYSAVDSGALLLITYPDVQATTYRLTVNQSPAPHFISVEWTASGLIITRDHYDAAHTAQDIIDCSLGNTGVLINPELQWADLSLVTDDIIITTYAYPGGSIPFNELSGFARITDSDRSYMMDLDRMK